jgi:hypothetical protein
MNGGRLSLLLFALGLALVTGGVWGVVPHSDAGRAGRVNAPVFSTGGLTPPARPDRNDLAGVVLGPDGPVADAVVRLQTTAIGTRSDASGRFRLPHGAGRVTAWKPGHFIAGRSVAAAPLELRLTPLPTTDNEEYAWVDPAPDAARPGNCGNCHADIYREWAGGGHARTADGRHFRGLYDGTDWQGKPGVGWGLLTERPDGAGVCVSCHAPSARDEEPGFYDLRELRGVAARGVHCDYCHKIRDLGDGQLGYSHGRFNLRLLRPADPQHQVFFGPFDDADRGDDAHSPLYRDSRYCASCHEGVVFGVHVYATYSEWQASPAARQGRHCQDCHMKPTGTMTNVAPGRGGRQRDPATLANHVFFAGSREEMLRRAVRVEPSAERTADGVRVAVGVRADDVGHRVPTGFIDRHLILVVEGSDGEGRDVAPRRGPRLPGPAADLAGRPGRLYAKLLTDFEDQAPAPFWRPCREPADTRLTPGVSDDTAFEYPAGLARLRVRLLYRRFWGEVTRAKGWPDGDVLVAERTLVVRP